ncbi:MAG: ubiquitin carboxyl-terminal hydrolase family protein [archaeon]|nr:ubiquitin carboxyl-terminal hydrolase family protein [archaeon]
MAGEEARRYGHPPESGAASCSTVAVAPPPRLHISQSMPQLDPLAGAPLGGLCGLRNLGNTCYFNSIVQALSHLPQLVAYYQSQYTAPPSPASRDRMPASVSGALGAHLQRYWLLGSGLGGERGSGLGGGGEMQIRVLDPRALLSHVCAVNPMFRGYAQHDAQELLRTVVDRMHDELKGPAVAGAGGESIISGLFGGALRSTVTCSVCRHSSHKEEPFYDLSLGLPDAQVLAVLKARGMAVKRELMELQVGGGGGGFFSRLASWAGFSDDAIFLEECLHAFCLPEALSGPNRLYCEHCRCPTDGVKTLRITRLPEVLVLHLKRFRYDSIWASKLSTEVRFQKTTTTHYLMHVFSLLCFPIFKGESTSTPIKHERNVGL